MKQFRGKEIKKLQKATYVRCPYCDEHYRPSEFHRHHKDWNHSNDDPKNLIRICAICHGKEHGEMNAENLIGNIDTVHEMAEYRYGFRLLYGHQLLETNSG